MALYMIGLGLFDEKDITLRGLETIKKCKEVFLENYTSILSADLADLEKLYGREVTLLDRAAVEQAPDHILSAAKAGDVAFLVVGDPMGATTHTDLFLRARKEGIDVRIINNASILNAVGTVGLELYRYGKTTSIVFAEPGWDVQTHYDVLKQNLANGLHTLCLLDIKVKEPSKVRIREGDSTPEPPRFMTINQGIRSLLAVEESRGEKIFTQDTLCIGIARLGADDMIIRAAPAKDLLDIDFGPPLHSLIIPGKLHFIEQEMLEQWTN